MAYDKLLDLFLLEALSDPLECKSFETDIHRHEATVYAIGLSPLGVTLEQGVHIVQYLHQCVSAAYADYELFGRRSVCHETLDIRNPPFERKDKLRGCYRLVAFEWEVLLQ